MYKAELFASGAQLSSNGILSEFQRLGNQVSWLGYEIRI